MSFRAPSPRPPPPAFQARQQWPVARQSLTMATVPSLKKLVKRLENAPADDTDLSDFTITCGDTEWRVHKLVLRLHEGALRAATQGDWKETQNGRLDLSVDPVAAIDALVQYLYKLDYQLAEAQRNAALMLHTQVCIVADKYRMEDMKFTAEGKFRVAIQRLKAPNEDLLDAIRATWDAPEPTSAIKAAILQYSIKRRDIFTDDKEERSPFVALMAENVDFAIEVAQAAVQKPSAVELGEPGETGYNWMRCPDGRCGGGESFDIIEHGGS
ncbi:hypothetical protein CKM354_000631000 [Cercospora kikuchii]|uniref:BTB domain-containing protein n=1 Tax=Cercospora kikuchii TaxID=84275 RepID=A0A9P3FDA2_9PEZI|nr:uncharacterized protein CKM354_000631000 [Cercospora kikuchii]GIZ43068.1 hypothetical protein CKM354_000631000 [Cercospora kikuchii]